MRTSITTIAMLLDTVGYTPPVDMKPSADELDCEVKQQLS